MTATTTNSRCSSIGQSPMTMNASSSSSDDEAADDASLVWAVQEDSECQTTSPFLSKAAKNLEKVKGTNNEEPIRRDVDCVVLQCLYETIERLADDAAVCLQDHQEASAIIWNELMDQVEERDVLDDRMIAKVAAIRRVSEAEIAAAEAEAASVVDPPSPHDEHHVLEISLRVSDDEDDEDCDEAGKEAAERALGGGACPEGAVVHAETQSPSDPETGSSGTAAPWRLFALEMEADLRKAEEAIEAEAQEERDLHGRVAEMLEDMRCRVRFAVHTERVARERSEEELLRVIEAGLVMSEGVNNGAFEGLPQTASVMKAVTGQHCSGAYDGVTNHPSTSAVTSIDPDVRHAD